MTKTMVLDDTKVIRDMMQAILENQGQIVCTAVNGVSASEIAKNEISAIIVSDLNIPKSA